MEAENTLIVVIFAQLVLLLGAVGALAWCLIRASNQLMYFHRAGQSMVEHQIRHAELEVRGKEADASRAASEAEKTRTEARQREMVSGGRFGGNATRTTVGAAPGVNSV